MDNDFISNQVDLTITGEWECAIHLDGRSDFSGGHTHGDEMMNTVTFIVDGVPVAVETLTSLTACNAFRIIQNSILYDPNDSVTQIAVHGKDYLYTVNGLLLGQSLKWLVSEPLTNCFLAMFLPSKNTIDRATVNSDYEILNLPSDTAETLTTIVKSNADNVIMWDTSSGFFADIRVLEYPTGLTGGDRITISDNNGGDYNKVYFKICGGGNSAIGETWKSLTEYKLDYK